MTVLSPRSFSPFHPGGNTLQGYVVEHWPNGTMDYVLEFQDANRGVIDSIPTPQQKRSAIFSSGCFRHCVTDSAAFWNVYVDVPPKKSLFGKPRPQPPMSLRDAVQAWFFEMKDQKEPFRLVSNCSGFRCGNCTTRGHKQLGRVGSGAGQTHSLGAQSVGGGPSMGDVLAGLGLGFFTLMGCMCCLLGSGLGGGGGGGGEDQRGGSALLQGGTGPCVRLAHRFLASLPCSVRVCRAGCWFYRTDGSCTCICALRL